jgi:hypothetical protein
VRPVSDELRERGPPSGTPSASRFGNQVSNGATQESWIGLTVNELARPEGASRQFC